MRSARLTNWRSGYLSEIGPVRLARETNEHRGAGAGPPGVRAALFAHLLQADRHGERSHPHEDENQLRTPAAQRARYTPQRAASLGTPVRRRPTRRVQPSSSPGRTLATTIMLGVRPCVGHTSSCRLEIVRRTSEHAQ